MGARPSLYVSHVSFTNACSRFQQMCLNEMGTVERRFKRRGANYFRGDNLAPILACGVPPTNKKGGGLLRRPEGMQANGSESLRDAHTDQARISDEDVCRKARVVRTQERAGDVGDVEDILYIAHH